MKEIEVAELVMFLARERGVADLSTFCASVRGWGFELPRFEFLVAQELAPSVPWSAEQIFNAFNPYSEEARR